MPMLNYVRKRYSITCVLVLFAACVAAWGLDTWWRSSPTPGQNKTALILLSCIIGSAGCIVLIWQRPAATTGTLYLLVGVLVTVCMPDGPGVLLQVFFQAVGVIGA